MPWSNVFFGRMAPPTPGGSGLMPQLLPPSVGVPWERLPWDFSEGLRRRGEQENAPIDDPVLQGGPYEDPSARMFWQHHQGPTISPGALLPARTGPGDWSPLNVRPLPDMPVLDPATRLLMQYLVNAGR